MAVKINDFSIIDNNTKLKIDLVTNLTYNITSVLLWKMNDFKDYTKSISLNYKLVQTNNIESIIVTNTELQISSFEDIWFIEVKSNEPLEQCPECLIPALGICYNLQSYYKCLLNELLSAEISECDNCNNLSLKSLVITLSLLIDSIEKSIDLGFYNQAILNIEKLKKLCSIKECDSCKKIECLICSKFNQTK